MTIDPTNDAAILSLSELHDMLADGNLAIVKEEGSSRYPSCIDLDEEAKQYPKAIEFANRLNEVLTELINLDSEFHDEFDCQ